MEELKLALLGFGNAAQAFAELLLEKDEQIRRVYNRGVKVTAVTAPSKGTILSSRGIDLKRALADVRAFGRFSQDTEGFCRADTFQVIEEADCDVVCEMTPLNIATGQPAIDHIRQAFRRGRHVVTANKGPVAWAFEELKSCAEENGLQFFYETTVMDGTPVFNLVEDTLKFCRVTEVSGILNSTTNYILEELAKGRMYDDILQSGRALGFVEADPSMDVEGFDAAAKITALLNVLMRAGITPEAVDRTGIGGITEEKIREATARGKVIKLLCKGSLADGNVRAWVKPVEIDRTDMLASVNSTTSVVSITTDLMGTLSIVEHEPDLRQTGYGVFSDVIRVLDRLK